jgi:hypothetical protein
MEEERDLSEAYRTSKQAPAPQGQGLNDLYIRFFRMAERRIVEKTVKGVVCLISNYSWLDGLSFTGMRERYLEAFDGVWIDCLNGDKYRTGKLTPEGDPDPSVFSTEFNREGIQVGTAIGLLVRSSVRKHASPLRISFRHFWGKNKRKELLESAHREHAKTLYHEVSPPLDLGLPFAPTQVNAAYLSWPLLPDLFPQFFAGVQSKRNELVIDIDRGALIERIHAYFNPEISHDEMRRICPRAMHRTARFDPRQTREFLLERGFLHDHIVAHFYRPFDLRWIYYEPETRLLGEKSPDYFPQVSEGNMWIVSQQKPRREWSRPQFIRSIGCLDLMDRGASCIPLYIKTVDGTQPLLSQEGDDPHLAIKGQPFNISNSLLDYLSVLTTAVSTPDVFYHTLATLHAPQYPGENSGALRQDWPRIPLPDSREMLLASSELGRKIATLLDIESPVAGVTAGSLRAELKPIGVTTRVAGGNLNDSNLALLAGWGHAGNGGVTMPGKGKLLERTYSPAEHKAIVDGAKELGLTEKQALAHLGIKTCDVYLNASAYWSNIPIRVWEYTIGGYQVIKKWLSYREEPLLGRPLKKDEVRYVQEMARRIAAILLLEPALDANYEAIKAHTFPWPPKP